MNIDDIAIFHWYTFLANELLFDRCDHFLLEFADWRLVIVKITRRQELLVEFLSQSRLRRVVVNSHKLQIEQLLIDDVLVEGQADSDGKAEHHEDANADSGQAPIVFGRDHLVRLLALYLSKEERVQVNGFFADGEVIVVEARSAPGLARALLHKEPIEVFLLEVDHLVVLILEGILIRVHVAVADSIVVTSE